MLSEYLWRNWRCPRTLQGAAEDFVRTHPGLIPWFADPELWAENHLVDWKRMIGGRYGLAKGWIADPVHGFDSPWPADWKERLISGRWVEEITIPTGIWFPGRNKPLLEEAGPEPQIAAERILQRVFEIARAEADGTAACTLR